MNNERYFEHIGAAPSHPGLCRTYLFGYVLSLICTLAAFFVATHMHNLTSTLLTVAALALVQCIVQGICFLHLGWDARSKTKLIVLAFAALVIGILVSGSLWIMLTLNARMTPSPDQMEQYMQDQGGF